MLCGCPQPLHAMRFPIPRPARPTWWSWWLLILGTTGFSALWVLLALGTSRQHAWMAVVGALDRGRSCGIVTCRNFWKLFAPSTEAASYRSAEIPCSPASRLIMKNG